MNTTADGPRLRIEVVPRPLWGKSLAKMLPSQKWREVRRWALDRAGNSCEVCGFHAEGGKRLICHEVWEYDDARHVQSLTGVEIHCADCDQVTHFGRTTTLGQPELVQAALSRLARMNDWPQKHVETYVDSVREQWSARNAYQWTQDTSWYDHWLARPRS